MSKIFTYSFPAPLSSATRATLASTLYGGQFPDRPMNLGPDLTVLNGLNGNGTMTQVTSTSAINQAFNFWSNAADVKFQAGTSTNHISIAYWDSTGIVSQRGSGTTFGVNNPISGAGENPVKPDATSFYIFLNREYNTIDPSGPADNMIASPTMQNWGVWNVAHEIGHTIRGSGHPEAGTLDMRYSIMSYPVTHNIGDIVLPDQGIKIPITIGMGDISLAQAFAASSSTTSGQSTAQDGNTIYTFTEYSVSLGGLNPTNVSGDPSSYVMTLWDRPTAAGGIDTIDTSWMTTSNYINLNAGKFSSIGSNISSAPLIGNGGVDYNVGIAVNAAIENVKGSQADDTIIGNGLANELKGNEGNDTLLGNGGVDFLYGALGNDAINGGTGGDYIDGGRGSNFLTGGSEIDTFKLDGTHGLLDTSTWWTTVTDFQFGEHVYLQGWLAGTSKQIGPITQNGAAGYTGPTFQYDMDGNNTVDVLITFTGTVTPTFSVLAGELMFS